MLAVLVPTVSHWSYALRVTHSFLPLYPKIEFKDLYDPEEKLESIDIEDLNLDK